MKRTVLYAVAPGKTIKTPAGFLTAPDLIPTRLYTDDQLAELERAGLIVAKLAAQPMNLDIPEPKVLTQDPGDLAKLKPRETAQSSIEVPPPVRHARSLWTFEPALLAGQDLQALQAMILERDPKFDACDLPDSVEGCVELMCRDYAGPKRVEIPPSEVQ